MFFALRFSRFYFFGGDGFGDGFGRGAAVGIGVTAGVLLALHKHGAPRRTVFRRLSATLDPCKHRASRMIVPP